MLAPLNSTAAGAASSSCGFVTPSEWMQPALGKLQVVQNPGGCWCSSKHRVTHLRSSLLGFGSTQTWAAGSGLALNGFTSAQEVPSATAAARILQGCRSSVWLLWLIHLSCSQEYNVINSWHLTKSIILYRFLYHSSPG